MERDRVSVCTTATLRPGLLQATYESFFRRVEDAKERNMTLYLNVDPVPKDECDPMDVVNVARKYFTKVIHNCPQQPNFCAAVNWLWSSADSQFIFHLEDDWRFALPLRIFKMISILQSHPNLCQIRLRKQGNMKFLYGLSPCLMPRKFFTLLAGNLNESMNPERQMRDTKSLGIKPCSNKTVINWPDRQTVFDIGRNWRVDKGMSKQRREIDFLTWEHRKKILR